MLVEIGTAGDLASVEASMITGEAASHFSAHLPGVEITGAP